MDMLSGKKLKGSFEDLQCNFSLGCRLYVQLLPLIRFLSAGCDIHPHSFHITVTTASLHARGG